MTEFLRRIIRFIPGLLSTIIAFVSVFSVSAERLDEEITEQIQRISELESAYSNGEIAPVDEASFFDGDLQAELDAGIKFNEMAFLATHNSYQSESTETTKKLYRSLSDLTFGLVSEKTADFESETLTNQLNSGIRSLELDIEVFDRDGDISFTCMHSPNVEMTTTCYDFELAMKEIALWSDNNPNHLPITIIIEPKGTFIPLKDMKKFNIDYADEFDTALRETLGNKLFTPADMLRDYSSFGEMRAADDWCKVKDMLGKVVILLHECNATEKYIALDPSFGTQAMFPMLRPEDVERDCTSFILMNKPAELLESQNEIVDNLKIIVRTRTDKFTEVTEERRENALASKAHIISTDSPPRTDNTDESYVVSFNGKTVRKVN